jgi:hypothetical protein
VPRRVLAGRPAHATGAGVPQVREPEDLVKELKRLSSFLDNLDSPWQSRMGCMQRFQTLVTHSPALRLPNFIDALDEFKGSLSRQVQCSHWLGVRHAMHVAWLAPVAVPPGSAGPSRR